MSQLNQGGLRDGDAAITVASESIVIASDDVGEDDVAEEATDIVAGRIQAFVERKVFPNKIIGAMLKPLARISTSLLNQCGVRVTDRLGVEWFICLLNPCYDVETPVAIKCTKSGTSNATQHLKSAHNIESSKTLAHNRRMTSLQEQLLVVHGGICPAD